MDTKNLVCMLGAIPPHSRPRYEELKQNLLKNGSRTEITELPNGLSFHLKSTPNVLLNLAEWIGFERACCPFLRFQLNIEPGGQSIELTITGDGPVNEFLKAELLGAGCGQYND